MEDRLVADLAMAGLEPEEPMEEDSENESHVPKWVIANKGNREEPIGNTLIPIGYTNEYNSI